MLFRKQVRAASVSALGVVLALMLPVQVAAPATTSTGRGHVHAAAGDEGTGLRGEGSSIGSSGSWAPLMRQPAELGGGPVRWNPCQTIDFKIRRGPSTRQERRLMVAELRRSAAAAGLSLEYTGTTDALPPEPGTVTEDAPDASLVIAFAGFGEAPYIPKNDLVAGLGGFMASSFDDEGLMWISSGAAVFDMGKIRSYSRATQRQMYRHEIGHALGLGHVDSPEETMHGVVPARAQVTDGWIAGMRAIGNLAGCPAPVPSP